MMSLEPIDTQNRHWTYYYFAGNGTPSARNDNRQESRHSISNSISHEDHHSPSLREEFNRRKSIQQLAKEKADEEKLIEPERQIISYCGQTEGGISNVLKKFQHVISDILPHPADNEPSLNDIISHITKNEVLWEEFRAELTKNSVTTGLGTQEVLAVFLSNNMDRLKEDYILAKLQEKVKEDQEKLNKTSKSIGLVGKFIRRKSLSDAPDFEEKVQPCIEAGTSQVETKLNKRQKHSSCENLMEFFHTNRASSHIAEVHDMKIKNQCQQHFSPTSVMEEYALENYAYKNTRSGKLFDYLTLPPTSGIRESEDCSELINLEPCKWKHDAHKASNPGKSLSKIFEEISIAAKLAQDKEKENQEDLNEVLDYMSFVGTPSRESSIAYSDIEARDELFVEPDAPQIIVKRNEKKVHLRKESTNRSRVIEAREQPFIESDTQKIAGNDIEKKVISRKNSSTASSDIEVREQAFVELNTSDIAVENNERKKSTFNLRTWCRNSSKFFNKTYASAPTVTIEVNELKIEEQCKHQLSQSLEIADSKYCRKWIKPRPSPQNKHVNETSQSNVMPIIHNPIASSEIVESVQSLVELESTQIEMECIIPIIHNPIASSEIVESVQSLVKPESMQVEMESIMPIIHKPNARSEIVESVQSLVEPESMQIEMKSTKNNSHLVASCKNLFGLFNRKKVSTIIAEVDELEIKEQLEQESSISALITEDIEFPKLIKPILYSQKNEISISHVDANEIQKHGTQKLDVPDIFAELNLSTKSLLSHFTTDSTVNTDNTTARLDSVTTCSPGASMSYNCTEQIRKYLIIPSEAPRSPSDASDIMKSTDSTLFTNDEIRHSPDSQLCKTEPAKNKELSETHKISEDMSTSRTDENTSDTKTVQSQGLLAGFVGWFSFNKR